MRRTPHTCPPWLDESLAANGRPILENFQQWFGQSMVVDAKGEPMRLFHGTASDFDVFAPSRSGEFGPGIYLTSSTSEANGYVGTNAARGDAGMNIVPVYARIEHPFTVRESPKEFWDRFGGEAEGKGLSDAQVVERARLAGHDGIIFDRPVQKWVDGRGAVDTGERQKHFVVFDAAQLKSSIGNSGLYLRDSDSLSDLQDECQLRRALQARALGWSGGICHAPTGRQGKANA